MTWSMKLASRADACFTHACISRSFVDNYHEREIKYEGFGERPSIGGRLEGPGPLGTP